MEKGEKSIPVYLGRSRQFLQNWEGSKMYSIFFIRSSAKVTEKQNSESFQKPAYSLYRLHNRLPLQGSDFALCWKSFAFVSQLLFSSLRPIVWNLLWRKAVLNNFKTVIKKYQKSVVLDLLVLLLGHSSQCEKFCVLLVELKLLSTAKTLQE